MARAKSIFVGFVVGTILASGTVALGAAGWSWYVDASGSASGSLAQLQALKVSDARGGDGLYPGMVMPLKVNVQNPNPVALGIASLDVADPTSGDDTCDASLAKAHEAFDATPDIVLQPGETDGVILGRVRLPNMLADSCQGRDLTVHLSIRAAFGASS